MILRWKKVFSIRDGAILLGEEVIANAYTYYIEHTFDTFGIQHYLSTALYHLLDNGHEFDMYIVRIGDPNYTEDTDMILCVLVAICTADTLTIGAL